MMAMLKLLQVVIVFGLLANAFSTDGCEPEDSVEFLDDDASKLPPDEEQDLEFESASKRLQEEGETDKNKILESDYGDVQRLERKPYDSKALIPTTPVQVPTGSVPLCDTFLLNWWIGWLINYKDERCYVLKPWRNLVFPTIQYTFCRRQLCKNMPICTPVWPQFPNWLRPYRWQCEPSNYRIFYIWVYCPTTRRYRRIPIKRAQCCECRRRRSYWYPHVLIAPVSTRK